MTTLYRPVLIESVEQAEHLPVGTVAMHRIGPGAAVRVGYGLGWSMGGEEMSEHHSHMVGWTALVPIEAEKGTDTIQTGAEHFYTRTRYVTPWESV